MAILIAFFSRASETYLDGAIFKIETIKAYPAAYDEATRMARVELRRIARYELAGRVDAMADYDVVALGSPNRWGTMPMALFCFLEAYGFPGKTIAPFCTHEGSGTGRSESDIKKLCPQAKIESGLAIRGGSVKNAERAIADWLGCILTEEA